MQTVTILGATGSIGLNTVDVILRHPDQFRVKVLTAHRDVAGLAELTRTLRPEVIVLADVTQIDDLRDRLRDVSVDIWAGEDALIEAAQLETDFVMAAIVGFAGLRPTLAAVRRGARIGLANKECLVAAGELFMAEAHQYGATILPVDSEHNAAFQLLDGCDRSSLDQLILTASGGPFRGKTAQQMAAVTPEQALAHPIWSMGDKISIDSATLMNKGLELIEAHYLFDLPAHQLGVLVHPQSIVHAMTRMSDGAIYSHKGPADMRGPIAFCMGWPNRIASGVPMMDLAAEPALTFEEADRANFPCLAHAEAAMRSGGAMPTILNAANEQAVYAFLKMEIGFCDIASVVAETLDHAQKLGRLPSVTDITAISEIDAQARRLADAAIAHCRLA